ncbi:ATP-binding protein [Kitasatospora sp. NBC_01287]|uniref:AAA family ATPase n=1 Tax=Kitasatospora sp. NBC_01287 TaxID=2903573 RepID=UPI00224D742E|nr:AAA family ATPase [Kitasatospora sp. NBC_01287]MCX4749249.1 ATP-binding protein [Kitasatospora sp. NBC_01287]
MPPKLNSRKPTGIVPWPFILVEGEEGAGKSYQTIAFSASKRIGQMYVMDLSEGSADEYAGIPGADFEVIVHDGSYQSIAEQVEAVWWEARRAATAGEPPVVFVIDSGSALWRMLSNWTYERAKRSDRNRAKLAENPDSNIDVGRHLWNDSIERWYRIVHMLQTLPGIAIMLARGKEISATDGKGQPLVERGRAVKEWKVATHKDTGFDSTLWVRMRRDKPAELIKARTLRFRVESGNPMPLPDFSFEKVIFDMLGCSTDSQPRDMPELTGDRTGPWMKRIAEAADRDACVGLWKQLDAGPETGLSEAEWKTVRLAVQARVRELAAPPTTIDDEPGSDAARLRAAAEAQQAEADAEFTAEPAPAAA